LLQELKEGERMVGELVELTEMAQAGVSKHLKPSVFRSVVIAEPHWFIYTMNPNLAGCLSQAP